MNTGCSEGLLAELAQVREERMAQRYITLRGRGLIIPGHPIRWVIAQFLWEPSHGCEVVERIFPTKATSLYNTHEEVADLRAVDRFVEQRVVAVSDRCFQDSFADIVIEWGARLAQKQREFLPAFQHVVDG